MSRFMVTLWEMFLLSAKWSVGPRARLSQTKMFTFFVNQTIGLCNKS